MQRTQVPALVQEDLTKPCTPQLLSSCGATSEPCAPWSPCSATREATAVRSPHTTVESATPHCNHRKPACSSGHPVQQKIKISKRFHMYCKKRERSYPSEKPCTATRESPRSNKGQKKKKRMPSSGATVAFFISLPIMWGLTGGSAIKNLPAMRKTQVQSLGQEDPLEKEMATHSSILAGEIPWTEEPG